MARLEEFSLVFLTIFCICSVACSNVPNYAAPPKRSEDAMLQLLMQGEAEQCEWPVPVKVKIFPDTITVRDGHAESQTFRLEYQLKNPELVSEIKLTAHADGIDSLDSYLEAPEITVRENGSVSLTMDFPGYVDFGPKVRLRARCPEGVSDWYNLGGQNPKYDLRNAPPQQIVSVNPSFIKPNFAADGGGSFLTLWGRGFTRECTAEAEVNGAISALPPAGAPNNQIRGFVSSEVTGNRPVCSRKLMIGLRITVPSSNQTYRSDVPVGFLE